MKGFEVRRPSSLLSRALLLACLGVALSFGASRSALAACGNGVIEPGEDCDDGSSNGTTNSCCTIACTATSKSPDVIVGDLVGRSGPYVPLRTMPSTLSKSIRRDIWLKFRSTTIILTQRCMR